MATQAAIMVRSTKLFDNEGGAPKGTTREFNILDNTEFRNAYGHMSINRMHEYAAQQVAKWNRMQPTNWRYELV
jgi:hypothetical protein